MNEDDRVVWIIGGAFLAVIVGPALLLRSFSSATHWLLAQKVLVPAHQAMLTIPATGAGVDVRRLLVLVLVGPGLVWAITICMRWLTSATATSSRPQPRGPR